jgi:hypothetical protein
LPRRAPRSCGEARRGKHAVAPGLVVCSLIWLALGCGAPAVETTASEPRPDWTRICIDCHDGTEPPGEDHADLTCERCHVESLAGARELGFQPVDRPDGHPDVAANPSHPATWEGACGGGDCHAGALARMQRSLHWTQAGILAQTRFLWGAQDRMATELTLPELATAPPPVGGGGTRDPAALVDDLLRRTCLRCHLLAPGQGGRSAGCAACHSPGGEGGAAHQLSLPSTSDPCLSCHQGDATGADFAGRFPADAHDEYRVPLASGEDRPLVAGLDVHPLTEDLHRTGGLICTDCHGQDEVMGRTAGEAPTLAHQAVSVRCGSCHGDLSGHRAGDVPDGLAPAADGGGILTLRADGTTRVAPPTTGTDHLGHDPGAHARLTCAACHAAWAGQAFGLHLHLSYVPTWNLWIPRDTQGDPELSRRVAEAEALADADRDSLAPRMSDRITGDERDGLWAGGHSLRRWEEPPLGVTANDRIAPLRPRNLYRVTYVAADGLVWLDSAIPERGDATGAGWASEPFTPHTTMPGGALCTRCHGNPRAAGLGLAWTPEAPALHADTVPARPATPGARLLDDRERSALLHPAARQRAAFAQALAEMGLEAWLPAADDEQDADR